MQTINDHLVASICIHFGFTLRLFYLLRFFPTVVGLAASFSEYKTQSLCTIFTLPLWFTRHTRTQGLQRSNWLNRGVLPGALSSLLPCISWLEESLSLLASRTQDSLIANTGKQVFVLFILLKGTSSLVSSRRFLPCLLDVILPHEYINGCSILVCNVENKIKFFSYVHNTILDVLARQLVYQVFWLLVYAVSQWFIVCILQSSASSYDVQWNASKDSLLTPTLRLILYQYLCLYICGIK